MTTAFYSHPDCHGHDMGQGHPECPQRLDAINDYPGAVILVSWNGSDSGVAPAARTS